MTKPVKIFRPNKKGVLKLVETIQNPDFNHDTPKQSLDKKRKKYKKGIERYEARDTIHRQVQEHLQRR